MRFFCVMNGRNEWAGNEWDQQRVEAVQAGGKGGGVWKE